MDHHPTPIERSFLIRIFIQIAITLFLLLFLCTAPRANADSAAQTTIVATDDLNADIGGQCELFVQKENISTESVLKGSHQKDFLVQKKRIINLARSPFPYWCKFTVSNPTDHPIELFLTYLHPSLRRFEVFLIHHNEVITYKLSGRDERLHQKIFGIHYNVKLKFFPGTNTLYVKSQNVKEGKVIFQLKSDKNNFDTEMLHFLLTGLINGLIILMGVFNLFFFISSRQIVYLFYSLYSLSKGIWFGSENGLIETFLPAIPSVYLETIYSITLITTYIAGIFFSMSYLNITRKTKYLFRLFLGCILLGVFLTFGQFILNPVMVQTLIRLLGLFLFGLYIATGVYLYFQKFTPAIIYVFGWSMGSIFQMWFLGVYTGKLPYFYGFSFLVLIGALLEEFILSLATGLKARYEITQLNNNLNKLNSNLEQIVTERTQQIKYILKSIKQGIFSFSQNFKINNEYSTFLETILGSRNPENRDLFELLFTNTVLTPTERDQLKNVLTTIIGENELNFDINFHLLPEEIIFNSKILEIQWQPISFKEDGVVDRMLVVLHDVTQTRHLKKEQEINNLEMKTLLQIATAKIDHYLAFYHSNKALIVQAQSILQTSTFGEFEINDLFRVMHTLKGNARMLHFDAINDAAHSAEGRYSAIRNGNNQINSEELNKDLQKVDSTMEYYHQVYKKYLQQDAIAHDLRSWIEDVTTHVIESTNIPGKLKPNLTISDDQSIPLTPTLKEMISTIFLHLTRNSLDHGIEGSELRKARNKPPQGQITIRLKKIEKLLTIEFYDDGAGLNLSQLRAKGQNSGLLGPNASDEEVANVIFASGISTAEKLTDISGHGVGMDAVKHMIEKNGGNIKIVFTGDYDGQFRSFKLSIQLYSL